MNQTPCLMLEAMNQALRTLLSLPPCPMPPSKKGATDGVSQR